MADQYDFEDTLSQFRGWRDEAQCGNRVSRHMRDARRSPEEVRDFEERASADIIGLLVMRGTYLVHRTRGVESATWFRVDEDDSGYAYDVVAHATSREGRLHMLACLLTSAVDQMERSLTGDPPHMAA